MEINQFLILLALATPVITVVFSSSLLIKRLVLSVSIASLFILGGLTPIGLICLVVFWGLSELRRNYLQTKPVWNSVSLLLLFLIALGFANHLLPGFNNIKVLNGVEFSSNSAPFSMYINIDKTMMAIILAVTMGIFSREGLSLNFKDIIRYGILGLSCTITLMSLALLSKYISFDFKFPPQTWIWLINNLLFVCFAEEVLFRGVVQDYLIDKTKNVFPIWVGIIIASLLFSTTLLGHLRGGIGYIFFVFIAGIFYGYAFQYQKRVGGAIAVHFMVNAVHFFFFTYPML